jgi:hypothetical protein
MKITLDNNRIVGLAADGAFVAEFPFLTSVVEQRACCGRVTGRQPDYESIRKNIVGMTTEKKAKFKEMLHVEEIMVHYNDGAKIQSVAF